VQGTNIVRKEHGIPVAESIAADPKLTLLDVRSAPAAAPAAAKKPAAAKPAKQAASKKKASTKKAKK
jgi:hypothetical protein